MAANKARRQQRSGQRRGQKSGQKYGRWGVWLARRSSGLITAIEFTQSGNVTEMPNCNYNYNYTTTYNCKKEKDLCFIEWLHRLKYEMRIIFQLID